MEEIFHPSSKFTLSYYSSCKLKLGETSGGGGSTISCEGATSTAVLKIAWEYREQVWDVILNGQLFRDLTTINDEMLSVDFSYIFNTGALNVARQSLALEVYWDSSSDVNFYNQGENPVRIILVPKNQAAREDVNVSQYNENSTVYKDEVTNEISFCLAVESRT